ncbi:MAG TPA: hypothetical protein VMZ53_21440 [Kofleriaceae bacterium]|nr:hypothetical protein [Kofleriaceae bacterium]
MGWLGRLMAGGEGELGWDDLIRRIVDAIAPLKVYGPKGEVTFPDEVIVRITVAEASQTVIQSFVDKPELDHEVGAALANRCDVAPQALPTREYVVSAADRISIVATQGAPRTWALSVVGGDRDGAALPLPSSWSELAFGRGAANNDLAVCEKTEFVSRRAGKLYRAGNQLEVASLDQGDELIVRRPSGETIRPARTARGRAVVKPDDTIELGDGRGNLVKLLVTRS